MATKIYLRRGTRTEILAIVPESGEPVWATDIKKLYIGDDTTSGGIYVGGLAGQVESLNGLTGVVTVSGINGITVYEDGQVIVVSGYDEFIELLDTPASYAGEGGKFVRVNATEDGVEFVAETSAFTGLTDTPASFSGSSRKVVAVNAGESALEFIKRINVEEELTSDHDYAGLVCSGVAGEELVFGEVAYFASDLTWYKTDADEYNKTAGHIAIVGSGAGAAGVLELLLLGYIRDDSWSFNPASGLFVSTTAGDMTTTPPPAAGDFIRRAGYVHKATIVYFCPDGTVLERS